MRFQECIANLAKFSDRVTVVHIELSPRVSVVDGNVHLRYSHLVPVGRMFHQRYSERCGSVAFKVLRLQRLDGRVIVVRVPALPSLSSLLQRAVLYAGRVRSPFDRLVQTVATFEHIVTWASVTCISCFGCSCCSSCLYRS